MQDLDLMLQVVDGIGRVVDDPTLQGNLVPLYRQVIELNMVSGDLLV